MSEKEYNNNGTPAPAETDAAEDSRAEQTEPLDDNLIVGLHTEERSRTETKLPEFQNPDVFAEPAFITESREETGPAPEEADAATDEDSGEMTEEPDEFASDTNEEQIEQLSLLDGQLPHLEAANAPDAKKAKAVLEGLLFITGDEGVTAEQAATALDITPELAAEYFDELMQEYTDDTRGIEIANYAGTYRFLSKAVVFDYAKRLFQITKTSQLSQAALETLAIIAYKQPITRVEIEEIRGVGADMMLRKLMARDLIRESGRSEAAGRPILYEVTEEFMNSFKLMSLKELPELPSFNNDEESEELFNQ